MINVLLDLLLIQSVNVFSADLFIGNYFIFIIYKQLMYEKRVYIKHFYWKLVITCLYRERFTAIVKSPVTGALIVYMINPEN